MCWTTYHCKLQCGVYAIVVALVRVFIADGVTAAYWGRCKLCNGTCKFTLRSIPIAFIHWWSSAWNAATKEGNALLHHITAVHSWTDREVACLHHPASAVLMELGEDCADCGVCSRCPPYTIRSWNISIFTSFIIHQLCGIAMHVSMWLAVLNFLVQCSRKWTPRSEGIIQQWVGGVTFHKCGNTWGIIMDVSKKYWNISSVASILLTVHVCEKICPGFQCNIMQHYLIYLVGQHQCLIKGVCLVTTTTAMTSGRVSHSPQLPMGLGWQPKYVTSLK
jgi:hypothetical protein